MVGSLQDIVEVHVALLLPCSIRKKAIWKSYKDEIERVNQRAMAYTSFCRFWSKLMPYLVITKPMTDLCWQCQQHSTALTRSTNTPDAEKSAVLRACTEHLEAAHRERSYYKTTCDQCKESIYNHFTDDKGQITLPQPSMCATLNSFDITAHYSFDYAQQVWLQIDILKLNSCTCIPRSTTPAILFSPDPLTSTLHGNVLYLGLPVRPFHDRLLTSVTRLVTVAKELMWL